MGIGAAVALLFVGLAKNPDGSPRISVALAGPSGSGKSTLLDRVGLLDRPTAGEVDLMGEPTSALRDAEMRARAVALLEEAGLSDRLDDPAADLSGGQQQRVAIARSLIGSPPLVLADEPTGNPDTGSGEQAFRLLRRFNESRGTAFLIVTRDGRIAARCDRVVHRVDGRIVSDAPPGQPAEGP